MRKLSILLLKNFLPIFFGALLFFTMLINAADLLVNIVRYLERDASILQILYVQFLYVPACIVFSLPIAILFSVSYSMGTLYSNNELIAVFASGVSLRSFIVPLAVLGACLSVFLFFFQDGIAIPMQVDKNIMSAELLQNRSTNLSQANITIQADGGHIVYDASFYDDNRQKLDDAIFIVRDDSFRITEHVQAQWASWEDGQWFFHRVSLLSWDENGDLVVRELERWTDERAIMPPESFQNQYGEIGDMTLAEADEYLSYLRNAGFPYRRELTRFYERFSFSFTPLIVTLLSAGIGGAFRKNILAMSLLVSLGLSVVYYSIQMLSGLFATLGIISSFAGAWAGTTLTAVAAMYILYRAKT